MGTEQSALDFNRMPPYQESSSTSRRAAEILQETGRALTLRAKVLQAIIDAGEEGITDREIRETLDFDAPSDAGARRNELVNMGLVSQVGEKISSTGMKVTRWKYNPGARPVKRAKRRELELALVDARARCRFEECQRQSSTQWLRIPRKSRERWRAGAIEALIAEGLLPQGWKL